MTLQRQVKKENVAKKPLCSSVAVTASDSFEHEETALCVMLKHIPKTTVGTVVRAFE